MTSKSGALAALFGPSNNDMFAKLLIQLSDTVTQCSRHFLETQGLDLTGMIAFEHAADEIVDRIHELLDNSFIVRFEIADSMKLKLSGEMNPWRVAKNDPAMPPNMAPIANAVSLVLVVLMPRERQAISSSRSASHARPTGRLRTRMVMKFVTRARTRIT